MLTHRLRDLCCPGCLMAYFYEEYVGNNQGQDWQEPLDLLAQCEQPFKGV